MDHPEENRFLAAIDRYLETEEGIAVAAYVATVAGRVARRSEQYHVLIGTTLHSAQATSSGGLRLNHGAAETLTLSLSNDALSCDLADAINGVLARHAAGGRKTPTLLQMPYVRAA